MKTFKKILRYLFFLIIGLVTIFLLLIIYPKGSLETQLKNRNVPAIGYAVIKDGKVVESKVIGALENGVPAP